MNIILKKIMAGEAPAKAATTLEVTAILPNDQALNMGSANMDYTTLTEEEKATVDAFVELVKAKTTPAKEEIAE